jgi:cytochrome c-type biogenesis protein
MKTRSKVIIAIILVVVIILASAAYLLSTQGEAEPVADFTLVDIDGEQFNLSDHRGKIVVLDFMYVDCTACLVAEKNLKALYPNFEGELHIISVDVWPDIDTVERLRDHRDDNQVNLDNWTFALDSPQGSSGYVYQIYNVQGFSNIYIIDKDGYATYHAVGEPSREELEKEINKAIIGAQPILVQQMSMVIVAILAGVASFFSPCAFPMLPGYMAYFLGLQTGLKEQSKRNLYKRAVFGGIAGGIGIISIYIIIGIIILSFGSAVASYIPLLGPIVGIILIILGLLMFTNIQYTALIRPFQILASKLKRKKKEDEQASEGTEESEKSDDAAKGYYIKLFRYGVGYGAAASACVAPLFIVLVTTASAASITGTFLDGLIVLLLFAFVVIGLMTAITIALTIFGQKATQSLSKYTEVIKKVSAIVLIIVGIALIAFYYAAYS